MKNKKAQLTGNEIFFIIVGVVIGLAIYFFLWGEPYSELNSKYQSLQGDYYELNQNYISLESNYTQLKSETESLLVKYQQCVGRENFFTWIDRFLTLRNLAKLIGLI